MRKKISIVVPCYNEREALPMFYKELKQVLSLIDADYELVLVDDGSKDSTAKTMKQMCVYDERVRYIIFSRNFGKEAAMYAGLSAATGDYVAIMDADLQDPPELLVEMFDTIKEGEFDCVATRRVSREGEPPIRSWFARQFYKLINRWSQTEIVDGARDFRLMSKQMVESVISLKERNRFSKGIFSWVGYKTKWLEYENIQRCAGETKWSFKKLFVYAIEGIIAFTLAPLYAIVKFGGFLMGLDIIATIVLAILSAFNVDCFTPVVVLILVMTLLTSLIIICLGVVAIYQAKIYTEIKNRPIYIVEESNTGAKHD